MLQAGYTDPDNYCAMKTALPALIICACKYLTLLSLVSLKCFYLRPLGIRSLGHFCRRSYVELRSLQKAKAQKESSSKACQCSKTSSRHRISKGVQVELSLIISNGISVIHLYELFEIALFKIFYNSILDSSV